MAIIIYYLFFSNLQPIIEIDEKNELTDFTNEKAHSFKGGMIVSSDWGDPCGSYMSDNTTILVLFLRFVSYN